MKCTSRSAVFVNDQTYTWQVILQKPRNRDICYPLKETTINSRAIYISKCLQTCPASTEVQIQPSLDKNH